MRRRGGPDAPEGMPAHLVEFDPAAWLDVDVSGAVHYGSDAERFIDLRRRNAWRAARWRWAVEHGVDPWGLP